MRGCLVQDEYGTVPNDDYGEVPGGGSYGGLYDQPEVGGDPYSDPTELNASIANEQPEANMHAASELMRNP